MTQRFGRAGAVVAMFAAAIGLSAGPASANQPAFHFEEDATGGMFLCESMTYTITSGSINLTIHEGGSASGNTNFTLTLTPRKVIAEDPAGNKYKIVGAFRTGGMTNAQRGSEQFTASDKFQIVEQGGGSIDRVNFSVHVNFVDGEATNIQDFDFGTCMSPPL